MSAVRIRGHKTLQRFGIGRQADERPGELVGRQLALRRDRRGGGWRPREVDLVLGQRAVQERLLPALGRLHDVVADVAEKEADLQAGRLDMRQERGGVGTVRALAVVGRGAIARGIGDQHVVCGLDRGQSDRGQAAVADRTLNHGLEGIVAAGVQDDQPQPARARRRQHQRPQRDGLARGVNVVAQLGIDRHQPVLATRLQAVAGEVDDRQLGAARLASVLEHGTADLLERAVEHGVDGETEPPERGGDCRRIGWRIGERRYVAIGAIADHQRDALLRARGQSTSQHQHEPCPQDAQSETHDAHPHLIDN
nr:hypothetical protein Hi04_10k_c209_00030 [uncultured bacterium]